MAGISVFLVEDNEQIREHLIPALADLGSASVLAVAQTEDEAVNWLAHHKGQWDLAVVDLFLAQGSGLGVVRWCRGRDRHQRVAVLTNYPTDSMREACIDAGADAFFDDAARRIFRFLPSATLTPARSLSVARGSAASRASTGLAGPGLSVLRIEFVPISPLPGTNP